LLVILNEYPNINKDLIKEQKLFPMPIEPVGILKSADIDPVKTATGYQLATADDLPAIDATLKVVAVKKGAKAKTLKLTVDQTGELFVTTTSDLTGYSIQIQRGSKVLKSVKVS
jgi:hypothetical protein